MDSLKDWVLVRAEIDEIEKETETIKIYAEKAERDKHGSLEQFIAHALRKLADRFACASGVDDPAEIEKQRAEFREWREYLDSVCQIDAFRIMDVCELHPFSFYFAAAEWAEGRCSTTDQIGPPRDFQAAVTAVALLKKYAAETTRAYAAADFFIRASILGNPVTEKHVELWWGVLPDAHLARYLQNDEAYEWTQDAVALVLKKADREKQGGIVAYANGRATAKTVPSLSSMAAAPLAAFVLGVAPADVDKFFTV